MVALTLDTKHQVSERGGNEVSKYETEPNPVGGLKLS